VRCKAADTKNCLDRPLHVSWLSDRFRQGLGKQGLIVVSRWNETIKDINLPAGIKLFKKCLVVVISLATRLKIGSDGSFKLAPCVLLF